MQLREMTAASGGRRAFLGKAALAGLGLAGMGLAGRRAWAETTTLPLPGGPGEREVTTAFPHKGPMILQRTRPPLLETPFAVFDQGAGGNAFTPNDRFYVRWHWAVIPEGWTSPASASPSPAMSVRRNRLPCRTS